MTEKENSLEKIRHELSTEDAVTLDVIISDWNDITWLVEETKKHTEWGANGLKLDESPTRWINAIDCKFLLFDAENGICYNVLVNQLLWAALRCETTDKHYLYTIQAFYTYHTTNNVITENPRVLENVEFVLPPLPFDHTYVRSLLNTTEVVSKEMLIDAILKAINDVRTVLAD